jgi:hypothetical protein
LLILYFFFSLFDAVWVLIFASLKLPLNLKERLKPCMTADELMRLENDESHEAEMKKQSSSFKIPMNQPTAAAAMMYNMQASQRERLMKITEKANLMTSSNNGLMPTEGDIQTRITHDGRVASSFIADVLKKDTNSKSKMAFKLFPYVCLRCKKELVLCDSPTQTAEEDLNGSSTCKVLNTTSRSILGDLLLVRSKTVGDKLSQTVDEKSSDSKSNSRGNVASPASFNNQDKASSSSWLQII